jgi:hypothetical protein
MRADCGLALACLLAVAACGKHGGAGVDAGGPPDGYRSPYLSVDAALAPVADAAMTPEPAAPPPAPEKPKTHPAAAERPYPLVPADELATGPDLELLGILGDNHRGGEALARIRSEGRPGLELARKALRSSKREARIQAAMILANLKDKSKETVKALEDMVLLDPDPDARATAAKAFVALRAPDAVPFLIRSVKEDPFETARENSAWALGDIGTAAAIPVLREALKDPATWVRLRAVSALKRLKARVAVPDLAARLRDDNPMVRERAREALKAITGHDAGDDPAAWKK